MFFNSHSEPVGRGISVKVLASVLVALILGFILSLSVSYLSAGG